MAEKAKKVFVAMSGGVDSSVSAALLKEAGYDVTGVFFRVWQPDFLECTRGDDRHEAMRAAAHLNIPFLTFDFEDEYKREVVDYMVTEYNAGRTPNPDVMCNKHVKFGVFLKKALEVGADYIATGHYAQHDKSTTALIAGADKNKDQTYFLWTLTQERLRHVLFPIGHLEKQEVRELARKFGLPNAERRESQGVCFIGKFSMRDFLKNFIPGKQGNVLDESGAVIGTHDGAMYYTLGQRHGFTLTNQTPETPPQYVVAKDIEKNTITASPHKKGELDKADEVHIAHANWILGTAPESGKEYGVRFRHRQALIRAMVEPDGTDGVYRIRFREPQRAVAPGQSLVVYDEKKCLGGGVMVV